jgi:hypothetical protein
VTDLTASINLYDSEIDTIHRVVEILRQRSESRRNYQEFQDEVKARFHDAGFVVDVVWYETNVEGVLMPEIVIKDRVDTGFQWDPNQQVHEVTSDLLNLGEGGVIKSSGLILPPGHSH